MGRYDGEDYDYPRQCDHTNFHFNGLCVNCHSSKSEIINRAVDALKRFAPEKLVNAGAVKRT